jgi:hypothetical protein
MHEILLKSSEIKCPINPEVHKSGSYVVTTKALLDAMLDVETAEAKRLHGPAYASHNEAFGVLYEELQEAGDEVKALREYAEYLCRYVRVDDVAGMADALGAMRKTAICAAAEAIQVAAVCQKWLEGLENAENET